MAMFPCRGSLVVDVCSDALTAAPTEACVKRVNALLLHSGHAVPKSSCKAKNKRTAVD